MKKYDEYIRGEHWADVRSRFQRERPWECAVCGSGKRLQLHHVTYRRLGNESLDDLVPLCRNHHKRTHALVKLGVPLAQAHVSLQTGEAVVGATVVLPPAKRTRRTQKRKKKSKRPVTPAKPRTMFRDWVCPLCARTNSGAFTKCRCGRARKRA